MLNHVVFAKSMTSYPHSYFKSDRTRDLVIGRPMFDEITTLLRTVSKLNNVMVKADKSRQSKYGFNSQPKVFAKISVNKMETMLICSLRTKY